MKKTKQVTEATKSHSSSNNESDSAALGAGIDNQSGRRLLRNFIIRPGVQIRYLVYILSVGLVFMLVMFSFMLMTLTRMFSQAAQIANIEYDIQLAIQNAIISAWIVFALSCIAFAGLSAVIGILLTHRVFGPIVPIRRHLAALKKGNYKQVTQLRQHDELKEVADDLNQVSELLEKRYGSLVQLQGTDVATPEDEPTDKKAQ